MLYAIPIHCHAFFNPSLREPCILSNISLAILEFAIYLQTQCYYNPSLL